MNTRSTKKREQKQQSKTESKGKKTSEAIASQSNSNCLSKTFPTVKSILKGQDRLSPKDQLEDLLLTQTRIKERDLEFLDVRVTFNSERPSQASFPYYDNWSFTDNLLQILLLMNVIPSEDKAIVSERDSTVNGYSFFLEYAFWYDLGEFVEVNPYGKGILAFDHRLLKGMDVRVARLKS